MKKIGLHAHAAAYLKLAPGEWSYSETLLALRLSLAKPLQTHATTRTAHQPKTKHATVTVTNKTQPNHCYFLKVDGAVERTHKDKYQPW